MLENNYDILSVHDGATNKEIKEAFRKLALQYHSDRGGDIEKFKKIKQAYDDLKIGKKYADSPEEKFRKSRVYNDETDDEVRKNKILAEELSKEMKDAERWASSLNKTNGTGTRLFGSKTLGEIEFERKANGALSIKGNYMGGSLAYAGPIIMQGNITSPSWEEKYKTNIKITKGDFKFINALENKYKIDNGAKITAENGDIVVGNVFGRKDRIQDPSGKVGMYIIKEHRSELKAPLGKIIVENVVNTVSLEANTIVALNLEDDIKVKAKEILIYGQKVTYDVQIELKKGGFIRFFEDFSIQGLSGDAIIILENGKKFRLSELKTKKIKDLPQNFINANKKYGKDDTMIGEGFTITYELLDNLNEKVSSKKNHKWTFKLGNIGKSFNKK